MEVLALIAALVASVFVYQKLYQASFSRDQKKSAAIVRASLFSVFFFGFSASVAIGLIDAATSPAAEAGNMLKPGYPLCANEALFNEMTQAYINEDIKKRAYLYDNGCMKSSTDIKFSIVKKHLASAEIRIYLPTGETATVWTNIEAIKS
jgi:hypothetical protein